MKYSPVRYVFGLVILDFVSLFHDFLDLRPRFA